MLLGVLVADRPLFAMRDTIELEIVFLIALSPEAAWFVLRNVSFINELLVDDEGNGAAGGDAVVLYVLKPTEVDELFSDVLGLLPFRSIVFLSL